MLRLKSNYGASRCARSSLVRFRFPPAQTRKRENARTRETSSEAGGRGRPGPVRVDAAQLGGELVLEAGPRVDALLSQGYSLSMASWRVVAMGAVVGGSCWVAACGSDPGKKVVPDDGGGAGGVVTSDAGGPATPPSGSDTGGSGGSAVIADGGSSGVAGNGGAPSGAAGTPSGDGGTGPGPGTQLTSCDAPIVIDDLPAADIAPDQATITQGPGGPTLITWREGDRRKGRVLTGDTLSKVVTFPELNAGSEYFPHFAVAGGGRLVYTTPNTPTTSLYVYDSTNDEWTLDEHEGLTFPLMQLLSNGDTLHVVTSSGGPFGSSGSLVKRSKSGVWAAPAPLYSIAPDRPYISQLLVDGEDRGALLAGTGQTAPALMGWALRNGAAVAEAALPIAANTAFTELFSALEPNGDVLSVYQTNGDTVTRAVTFSYDADADEATFSEPIELAVAPGQPYGLVVNAQGDATLWYSLAAVDRVVRRVDGVWGEPTTFSASDGWYADPVVDANGTTFVARSFNELADLQIVSSAAGSSQWSPPIDVAGDFGWTDPQRPRLGLDDAGRPMVVWTGSNSSGGRDILLSVCH